MSEAFAAHGVEVLQELMPDSTRPAPPGFVRFASDADPISFANDSQLVLLLFACTVWEGELEGKDGQVIKWVAPGELERYEMPPLDAELVLSLREFMMGL